MAGRSMVTIEPPSIDQRIANQSSFFSIVPSGITDFEKFLDENLRRRGLSVRWLQKQLTLQGVRSEREIFLGLCGADNRLTLYK